ncbi:MAG: zinc ribbon domain-containing protein [Gemmatimonadaceae bacterium]
MDSLDRMYQLLVRTIRTQFPQYETQPFEVAELYQTILPYRHNRRELRLDSNEDYEIVLTELLSGARDYVVVDDLVRDTLRGELASPNPDPGAFKQFANASVSLSPAAMSKVDMSIPMRTSVAAPRVSAPAPISSAASAPTTPMTQVPRPSSPVNSPTVTPSSAPTSAPSVATPPKTTTPRPGDRCSSCDQPLPAGREITFCPHCGQNLTTISCLACGSELELGWKFCPVCGRPASAHR